MGRGSDSASGRRPGEGFTQAEANKYKSLQGSPDDPAVARPWARELLSDIRLLQQRLVRGPATSGDRVGQHSSNRVRVHDDLTDNSHKRVIGGIAYWLAWNRARLGLVATNEQVNYDPADKRADENRILLQTHVEF